ncbi:MAG: hypothetical protein LPJ89_01195 [Hymenobacteraceae bacterium]|nr:hypothetical protein [Hymenobacteraceae bacterium]MDX5396648.1 hypothetical protein [Hymenobacteraceae bacterium]MDX5442378.1 hypothetical protein [Hymenobacteraceae bacterium]MDX5512715.1 hypothetical protein [Hymenobacteraceae bacterium]
MRTFIKIATAPLLAIALALGGCDSEFAGGDLDTVKVQLPNGEELREASTPQPSGFECGYDARQTEEFIEEKLAVVEEMDPYQGTFMLVVPSESRRFHACNLPAEWERPGTMVIFSGEAKEIYANERWVAQPFKLWNIRQANVDSGSDPSGR